MKCTHTWKFVAKNFYKNGNTRSWVFQCNECGNIEIMNKKIVDAVIDANCVEDEDGS